jgi:Histidine kinase-, DNA gyrase B-, and HSP90-like ATPase
MGETRVDLVHILEDLRDAYPGSIEDTILTEILANALDSGARTLDLRTDRSEGTLTACDNGRGMTRRELARYHDLGATSKRRGRGIGFAGVGIKLGLLACDEVITETRRGRVHAATRWKLSSQTNAPWTWIEPPHMLEGDGTAVLLRPSNPLSPLLDAGFLEATALRNFQPLFEPEFIDILAPSYANGFGITIDDRVVVGPIRPAARPEFRVRVGRQRKPSGIGYLSRHADALPEPERGLAISTMGKVIRRGWDWLGITPADADRIEGLVEVPALAEALTLNKGDFLRTGSRGALFLSYRKAIQEAVSGRLESWGETPPPAKRAPRTRPLERDIRRVLGDLAEEFPLLTTLVERTAGGQRRLPLGDPATGPGEGLFASTAGLSVSTAVPTAGEPPSAEPSAAKQPSESRDSEHQRRSAEGEQEGRSSEGEGEDAEASTETRVTLPGRGRRKRAATLSLQIRFESLDDETQLGRLIESTVWVNEAHPAYRRAVASRAEAYHIALAVAAALAPLAVEPEHAQRFISVFLARWGAAAANGRKGR